MSVHYFIHFWVFDTLVVFIKELFGKKIANSNIFNQFLSLIGSGFSNVFFVRLGFSFLVYILHRRYKKKFCWSCDDA